MAKEVEKYIAAAVAMGDVGEYRMLPKVDPFLQFLDPAEKALFDSFESYVHKFKVLPTFELLETEFGKALKDPGAPPAFWASKLEMQHLRRGLAMTAQGIGEKLNSGDEEKLLETALASLRELDRSRSAMSITDFRKAGEIMTHKWANQNKMAISLGWPTLDAMSGGARPGDLYSMVARPKMGKATPLDSPVLLANGHWKRMGDLQVGDHLASHDGAPSQVTGVFPQGVLDVYRLTFSDGRTAEASGDHLWEVFSSRWASNPKILSTEQIISEMGKARNKNRLAIRLLHGDFGSCAGEEMPPYLLGVLLGDGCFRGSTPTIASADPEILERAKGLLADGYDLTYRSGYDYGLTHGVKGKKNQYTSWLKAQGLWGKSSLEKHLPEQVFGWAQKDRLALLQGLMDTDGWVQAESCIFGSSSPKLAAGVQRLAWSLGATATLKSSSNNSFRVNIRMPWKQQLFHLPRKADKQTWGPKTAKKALVIKAVEKVRKDECQCISVSHPSKLFVTENYVVTHNTYLLLFSALHVWLTQRKPVMFVTNEMVPEMIVERLAALYARVSSNYLKKGEWPSFAKGKFQGKQSDNLLKAAFMDKMHVLELDEVPFWIADSAMASTVNHVASMADKLGVCMVFDDGAYLHQDDSERDPYKRVAKVCGDLKQKVATDLRLPCFASWQFARSMTQLKAGETPGIEHIAHADAIGQLSSVAMGMFETENIEAKKRREVKILAGRSGETGGFETHWDFTTMDLSEIVEHETTDELEMA